MSALALPLVRYMVPAIGLGFLWLPVLAEKQETRRALSAGLARATLLYICRATGRRSPPTATEIWWPLPTFSIELRAMRKRPSRRR